MTRRSSYQLRRSNGLRKSLKWKLFLVLLTIAGALVYLQYFRHQTDTQPVLVQAQQATQTVAETVTTTPEPNHTLPARLVIPDIKVDARVLYMGLTKGSSMEVPSNITDVGWYKYGPLPGNKGSAVIAGHIDGLKGQPGVFVDLSKLQLGSAIFITDTNGSTTNFIVKASKKYGQNDQPDEVFHSSDGVHLNLITCTGDWDKSQHQFLERLVVFADKE